MTIAIKNWFMEKEHIRGFRERQLEVVKETEKAIYVSCKFEDGYIAKQWIPKSCICDEWEKETSPLAYHEYLLDLLYDAYKKQILENYTITSGYNRYNGDAFYHQKTTAEIKKMLNYYKIEYMEYKDWKNR